MRKILISLLLAGVAATPAIADPDHNSDKRAAHAERQAPSPSEAPRAAPPVQMQRPEFAGQGRFAGPPPGAPPQQLAGHPQFQRNFEGMANGDEPPRNWRGPRREQVSEPGQPNPQIMPERREKFVGGNPQVIQDRRERFDNPDTLRHLDRPLPPVMRTQTPVVSTVPRPGTMPPLRVDNRRRDEVRWDTNWRRDDRYDWRRWRERHRSWFRLGIYYDPFGWGYQPYSIGWRLWPNYYSTSFWINDPWEYRLPYAPPGTRWIRYYNDALLVDMWTGEVVDVIYDFFW